MPGSRVARCLAVAAVLIVVLSACDAGKASLVAGGDTTFARTGAIVAIPGGGSYIVDTSACEIRKVDSAGTVTTVAGTGTCGYSGDGGPATAARINPYDSTLKTATGHLALDAAGNLYLSDTANGRIRKITTTGTITTVAGNGTGVGLDNFETDTCSGTTAVAGGITITPDGSVYVACPYGIGKILPNGSLQQVLAANPSALISDASGNLYFDSYYEGLIKKLDPATGIVTNVSDLTATLGADANNRVPIATDLAIGPDGTLFAAFGPTSYLEKTGPCYGCAIIDDVERSVVVRISNGTPERIAGTGDPDPGTGVQSGFGRDLSISPAGIAIGSDGNLLISSSKSIYRIKDPSEAGSGSGSACSPALFHPGADLTGTNLTNLDLHRCDLSGINLTGADLTGTNLDQARGTGIIGTPSAMPPGFGVVNGTLVGPGVDLSNQDLQGVVFDGMNLSGAKLTATKLGGASFVGTNLTGADLTGADMNATDLSHADLTGAKLNDLDGRGCTTNNDFTGANLTNATFGASSGCAPIFTDANLSGTDLSGVFFSTIATMKSGGIVGTPQLPPNLALVNGYLVGRGVDLAGVDLAGQNLAGLNLTSGLSWSNLSGADLSNANLAGMTLSYSNFTTTNLTGADLTGVLLTGANLTTAIFTNANLTTARIFSATTTGANLGGTTTTGIASGDLIGAVSVLPTGISYPHNSTTVFVGPGVDLRTVNLKGLDLSGMDLTGAMLDNSSLNNADFTGVMGNPSGGATAYYSNTTCPDATVASSPATCVSHGFGN